MSAPSLTESPTQFVRLSGIAAQMPHDNIDTDAIIPVPWMKSIRQDYAQALFANWRWKDGDGVTEIPSFILNQKPYRNAVILIGGVNFGCGSSREAAVWALKHFGIRCVIAQSFGEIFQDNCFKNGVLPLAMSVADIELIGQVLQNHDPCLSVDLKLKELRLPNGQALNFDIDPGRRHAMLLGLDEIGITLLESEALSKFERTDLEERPWAYFQSVAIKETK